MEPIADVVTEFLDSQEWPYAPLDPEIIENYEAGIRTAFNGQNGQFDCLGLIDEDKRMFIFYTFAPIQVPVEKIVDMMEFVTRANYDMYIGNFEIDLDDGELRFKASVDFDESMATQSIVKGIVFMSVLMMDRYWPGIVRILEDGISPIQEIGEVEEGWSPSSGQVSA